MLITRRLFLASASSTAFVGRCGNSGSPPAPPGPPSPPAPPGQVNFNFSFAENFAGWEPAYADYAIGQEPSIRFAFGHERLPPPLDDRSGLYLESLNVADDVFMYVSRLLDGLAAGARYRVELSITLATNAPPGCFGIGGAPGEAVTVKAGAAGVRPDNVVEQGFVRPNFDKGDQSEGGRDLIAIGDFAQETMAGDCLEPLYSRKTLATGSDGPVVTSDSQGRLWLILGTDSGYEGLTRAYFLEGSARLARL